MTSREQEGDRIAGVYSRMSDEQLAKIAEFGFGLSEIAQQALHEEIRRRGLDIQLAAPPGTDVYELNEIVTIRQFRDLPEALLAKGGLESAGIESYLADDNMVRIFVSTFTGGVRLHGQAEEADAAA